MFSRRSPRRRRSSVLGSFIEKARSHWSHSNVDRVFGMKRGYSRRLGIETLEDRRLLTTNVYFDNVNNQMTIVDDYADDRLQTDDEGEFDFDDANNIQEDNDVTLSHGSVPGRLRIEDPLGVILEPEIFFAGDGTQISDTVVEINATAVMRVDLQGGNDRLTTAGNFNLVATLTTLNVRGGDSGPSDGLILTATAGVAETVTITTDDPDQAEQDITGYAGKTLNVRGYESIFYDGSSDDNLIVDLGFGEATARVQNSAPADTDEVVSSTLPTILFNGLANFTLRGDPGESTTATFVIDSLAGATSFTFASEHDDTLVIEGNGGADAITATLNAGNLRVSASGNNIDTTGMNAGDLLHVVTFGGNDSLLVNIGGIAPIPTPIEFDGGTGSDILLVQGAPVPAIVDVVYTPGLQPDEGRLEYRGAAAARLMSIDFDNLEPIVDLVVAPTLIINGTPESNAITYTAGTNSGVVVPVINPLGVLTGEVTVDNYESVEFANKTAVIVNGLSGDDVIVADNGTVPLLLNNITFNGDFGNDTIRIENLPAAGGTFAGALAVGGDGNDIIDASLNPNATPIAMLGGAGNDSITGGIGNDNIDAGTGNDTIIVSRGNDIIDGGNGIDDDALVIRGTVDANTVTVQQAAAANTLLISIDGFGPGTNTIADLELLRVELGDGNDQLILDLPNAQLITLGNNRPIFYDGGTGNNSLTVQGAFGGGSVDSVIYTPGSQVDEGRILYTEVGQIMDVRFDNLAPIFEFVVAASLVVNGTAANNSITYRQGSEANRGLVTVDGFELMQFTNKTALTLNGDSGDDTIVLDNGAIPTALATITVNADFGNDNVRIEALPPAGGTFISATINGGDGNDVIDASTNPNATPLTLTGGAGNDTITGGLGVDNVQGGTNDDTLIDSPAADIYSGNGGIDTLVFRGTVVNNLISVIQNAPSAVVGANYELSVINGSLAVPPPAVIDQVTTTNAGLAPNNAANLPTIERIVIEALDGDDYIAVSHNDAYSDLNGANGIAAQTIPIRVIGDAPNASDRLVVQDNGIGDLVIHREAPDRRSGSIVVGGMAPVTYESTERVDIIPLDNLGQTGAPPAGRLIVFKDDSFETNESETNATPLGLEPVFIGLRNIDPGGVNLPPFGEIPGDEDWYEFRPQVASTFRFEIFFEHIPTLPSGRPGLPGDGNLRLDVFRANGVLIASSDISTNTPINVDSSEFVEVAINPAITESVFIRVQGAALPLSSSPAINNYDILATEVDDEGPVVFDPPGAPEAIFPNNLVDFDLFTPKPDNLLAGATPQIFSLTINIQDIPDPAAPGDPLPALDTQSASQPGVYRLVGDHVGIIDIQSVEVLNNFQVSGTVDAAPAPTTTTFRDAGLVGENLPPLIGQQTLVGSFIQFTSGANSGLIRTITAYNPATGDITLNAALPVAPAAGDTFTITSSNNAQVRLNFREALPDDRYTLTLLDSITDPAGNRLDGESDAVEPGTPTFPSGNGVPGGDFQARFTVDTRPEIGAAVAQDIDIDINGNYFWDPANSQIGNDTTNIDLSFNMNVQNGVNGPITTGGFNVNDLVFAGRFTNNGAGLPNRLYDMLGVYGFAAELGNYRFLIDTNGDGIVTLGSSDRLVSLSGGASPVVLGVNVAGALPIAGNFNNNAADGDEIGLYFSSKWLLDTNHDFVLDTLLSGNMTGAPVVGDFDGDGDDDLATFNNNQFFFDLNRDGFLDASLTTTWGYPGVLDRPIAADIDQDGIDDVGLWVPRNSANLPREVSEWYFLISDAVMAPVTDRPELVTDNATTTSFFAQNLIGANASTINGKLIRFLSGANVGQVRTVTSFNNVTGQVTFNGSPLASAPQNGDIFSIGGTTNTIELLNHAFSPTPFGFDVYAEFGDELALPLIGNFDPPASPTFIAPNTGITGDYDNNSVVNNADYTAWRANFGSTTNTLSDGSHDGTVNAADFVLWRNNAPGHQGAGGGGGGETAYSGGTTVVAAPAASSAVVEEPAPAAASLWIAAPSVDASSSASSVILASAETSTTRASSPSAAAVDSVFSGVAGDQSDSSVELSETAIAAASSDENLLLTARGKRLESEKSEWDAISSSDDDDNEELADSALAEFDEVFAVAW